MSERNDSYDVQVDWATVVPDGDALAIRTHDGFDDRWVEALGLVLDEHQRNAADRQWSAIDLDYASQEAGLVLFVRRIEPGARSADLRRTVEDLVKATNTAANIGTHVYALAHELREPWAASVGSSTPPPQFDPLADELDVAAA